ncbi:MAG: hypothetical protein IPJ56_11455 [Gemmatimonadetes bacterium]|nr:hypothetical protein [Gemmatimonadota bacterium]MBK7832932.1 hypothetical protein [Gemmatimonadota bacterium]
MRRLITRLLVPLTLVACASAARDNDPWTFLGQQAVTDRLDHDAIVVTAAEGRFTAIQIRVLRSAVDFHKVVVHFRNGGQREVPLRLTIPAGGSSRRIDLAGDDRAVRRVEFWYDARTTRGRQATVRLFAQR